ncbi:hypothetical protein D3C72_1782360 [compost metagenome]
MRRAGRVAGQKAVQIVSQNLAAAGGERQEAGATGEPFGRAVLVHRDMGHVVAHHRVPGLGDGRERQTVGGSARGDEKGFQRCAEGLAQHLLGARAPVVIAISGLDAAGGLHQGLQDSRGDAGLVVAAKVHCRQGFAGEGCDFAWVNPLRGAPA